MTLTELADKVEKATGPDRELSAAIALAVHDWLHEVEGNKPLNCRLRNKMGSPVYIGGEVGRAMDYTASIDAAMSLVPEKHAVEIAIGSLGCHAAVISGHPAERWDKGYAPTPALALVAAALRAREAK